MLPTDLRDEALQLAFHLRTFILSHSKRSPLVCSSTVHRHPPTIHTYTDRATGESADLQRSTFLLDCLLVLRAASTAPPLGSEFWIDVTPEAQVKIMDFSNRDKLIFETIDSGLTMSRNDGNTMISFNDKPFLRLENFSGFSFERHAQVGDFEGV